MKSLSKRIQILICSALWCSLLILQANNNPCTGAIEEINGLVVIEAENLNYNGTDWAEKTVVTNYSQAGYLEWVGNNYFNAPGTGILTASIEISTTGVYRFQWRNRVGQGDSSTDFNDSWLRFPDASDFYAQIGTSVVYPHGSGKTPNPEGSGADGWFKVYLSGTLDWTWSTNTYDNNIHAIFVRFDTPGTYTMEVSGRSKHHLVDRMVLYNGANNPLDLNQPESNCDTPLQVSQNSLQKTGIQLSPIPASDNLTIDGLANGDFGSIWSLSGQNVMRFKQPTFGKTDLDLSELSSGVYILSIEGKGVQRFVVD